MQFHCNKANPCLSYKWVNGKLVIWISWVDDCLNAGPEQEVREAVKQMNSMLKCKELGELAEYVSCKIDYNKDDGWMRLMQPILLQSYEDKFGRNEHGLMPHTPVEAGSVLEKEESKKTLGQQEHNKYQTGVGKLLHMS
eukprot:539753-Ditylum_brightwellii.AAC.1